MNPGRNGYESYPAELVLEADVCILGSGAGGSSAAAAISEAGLSVIVLEEGRNWRPEQFQPSAPWAFKNLYAGRGTRGTQGNAFIPIPGGRGVGGSTLINSAICFRTPEPVLADWRDRHGCHNFGADWMNACFERIWSTIGVTVNPPEVQRDHNRIFKAGADALGLDAKWMARSAPGCTGCGTCQQGCATGGKFSIDRTFLAEAILRGNVGVYADCRVDGVETSGGRVTAVTGRTIVPGRYIDGGWFRVRAKKFLVSGGSIGSPRFLLRNGLSDGPVGENFHIHPTAGVVGRFPQRIEPWHGVTQGCYVDRWDEGYLLQTFSMPPDQWYIALPLVGDELDTWVAELAHMASAGTVVHDTDSTGRVTEHALAYTLGDGDRKKILAGLRMAGRIYLAAGADAVVAGVRGSRPAHTPEEIDAAWHDDVAALDIGLYAAHPMGTCRMGSEPATSVVDPDGRVWGWDNLWVADTSIFPTSLGVNPQVTTMAVGLTVGRQLALA